jgi:hypothetical protein
MAANAVSVNVRNSGTRPEDNGQGTTADVVLQWNPATVVTVSNLKRAVLQLLKMVEGGHTDGLTP